MKDRIQIYDSTLRDGAQGENISFSVEDKINITLALDKLGVDFIEAGNPGSNPKDLAFFDKIANYKLEKSKLVAFGSTRRKNIFAGDDSNVKSLLLANTEYIAIFGKSWDLHATKILNVSLEENLAMVKDTIEYLCQMGKKVVFDAEHFFDGYKNNPSYAMEVLSYAVNAGAVTLCLCDTNGGSFPNEITEIVKEVKKTFPNVDIGIHAHNDNGLGVANSINAVLSGARQVQGTLVGFGERCGNANLSTIISNLQIKLGYPCLPEGNITDLTSTTLKVADISNVTLSNTMPYVGASAFTHKAGMHADGVLKSSVSFEHINPEEVGNTRRFLLSEIAGKAAIVKKVKRYFPELNKDSQEIAKIAARLKELELQGYSFESAEASFIIEVMMILNKFKPSFELISFKAINEQPHIEGNFATAVIKVRVGEKTEVCASEGDGPVNALDKALRLALSVFYPEIEDVKLVDYKVRVIQKNSTDATASQVRVLITSTDGESIWSTVGVSVDIIEASWKALVDSIEYKLKVKNILEKE